ncbi:MAG: peptide deformylase [Candidatus Omnitrophica bacterium]|nr:peptide deformylase [Candidatus Omnitrophota bacterium]
MPNVLELKKYPDKILRVKCKPVKKVDDDIRAVLNDMAFTMRAHNGVGLAATQVGLDKQLIVVDVGGGLISMVNPEIIEKKGEDSVEEGCLSLPEITVKISRAEEIQVKALDETGRDIIIDAKGLLAIAIQHEIDHINGILIIDRVNFIKKHFFKNKLLKNKKTAKST